jgi:hypothetical protein
VRSRFCRSARCLSSRLFRSRARCSYLLPRQFRVKSRPVPRRFSAEVQNEIDSEARGRKAPGHVVWGTGRRPRCSCYIRLGQAASRGCSNVYPRVLGPHSMRLASSGCALLSLTQWDVWARSHLSTSSESEPEGAPPTSRSRSKQKADQKPAGGFDPAASTEQTVVRECCSVTAQLCVRGLTQRV